MNQKKGSNILIVDDSLADIELITFGFEDHGITNEVIPLTSGQKFLDYLQLVKIKESPIPALVLLDINMPGISGHEALKKMRQDETFSDVPAVAMLTHSTADKDKSRAKENGADGYFIKPSSREDWKKFCDFVRKFLESPS
jgi:two-component system response regulator